MQSNITLRTESWIASGTRVIPLTGLPPGKRCRALKLWVALSGTKTGGVDALTADNFALAVSRVQVGEYVNIAGESLWELMKSIMGKIPTTSGDIAAAGATFIMEFPLTIPFRDPRQTGSDDGSIPSELLDTLSILLTFASATVHGVGTLTITAGTIFTVAEMVEETAVPQVNRLYDFQPGNATFQLEPGVYKELFILDGGPGTNGTITTAELTTIDVLADGLAVWQAARHENCVSAYNNDVQNDAAGDMVPNSVARFPVGYQDRWGKSNLTKQFAVEKGGSVRISSGTIAVATMTVVAWRALPKSEAAVTQIADAVGMDRSNHQYHPNTASKAPLGAIAKSKKQGRMTKKARLAGLALPGAFQHMGSAKVALAR